MIFLFAEGQRLPGEEIDLVVERLVEADPAKGWLPKPVCWPDRSFTPTEWVLFGSPAIRRIWLLAERVRS